MYVLGVLSGMLLAWGWLVFASPYARKTHKEEVEQRGTVEVRCNHCGQMSWVNYGEVRVDTKCMKCR